MTQPSSIADKTASTLTLFQAKILLINLKFEAKTGLKTSSKVNSKRIAAKALGLSTRTNYDVLIEKLIESISYTNKMHIGDRIKLN